MHAFLCHTLCDIMNDELKKTPHCLWHISAKEWKAMKPYSFHVTGLLAGEVTAYNNVTLGSNIIAPMKRSTSHGNTIQYRELNLAVMSGGYEYITTAGEDLQLILDSKSVILINTTNQMKFMSGIVFLAVVHLNKYRRRNGFIWGREHYNMAKSCKNNILTDSTKHHESAG